MCKNKHEEDIESDGETSFERSVSAELCKTRPKILSKANEVVGRPSLFVDGRGGADDRGLSSAGFRRCARGQKGVNCRNG